MVSIVSIHMYIVPYVCIGVQLHVVVSKFVVLVSEHPTKTSFVRCKRATVDSLRFLLFSLVHGRSLSFPRPKLLFLVFYVSKLAVVIGFRLPTVFLRLLFRFL